MASLREYLQEKIERKVEENKEEVVRGIPPETYWASVGYHRALYEVLAMLKELEEMENA